MKTSITFILVFLSGFITYGQDDPRVRGHYLIPKKGKTIMIYRSAKNDKSVTDSKTKNSKDEPDTDKWNFWGDLSETYYFKTDITAKVGSTEYIRFYIPNPTRYDKGTKKFVSTPNFDNPEPWENNGDQIDAEDFKTWLWVSKKDYEDNQEEYFGRFNTALILSGITTPFKYRFKTKDKESSISNGDVNLGGLIGYRLVGRKNNWGISLGVFGGLSSLSMNASNNDSVVDKNSQSVAGLNYGGALVIDVKKNYQFGIVAGFDHATDKLSKGYVYQDKMWLGLSLNFKFLDFGKKTEKQTNTKTNG